MVATRNISFLVVLIFSVFTCKFCYVIVEGDPLMIADADKIEVKKSDAFDNDINSILADDISFMQSLIVNGGENDDYLDIEEEALKEAIAAQFGFMLDHLVSGDELNKDLKLEVIVQALESAFLKITGTVDREFIDNILIAFQERERQREMQKNEHEFNRMDAMEDEN